MDTDFQWEFANTLGEGAYGEVRLALHTRTQELHAIKIISLNLLSDKSAIQKEVLIHKALNHENIVKFLTSFEQAGKYFIVLEYASGGELFDRIEPDFGMQVEMAHQYFQQLINGVEYIHSKGIVHRDLKPENLLLNDNDVLKIADFGLATLFQYKGVERLLTSPCGTAPYVATEVLSQREYKAEPTDIWSCGIILVAMLAGELPWDKPVAENKEFSDWIENDYYKRTPWCKLENTSLSLLRRLLSVDPQQRITLKQIKQSAWYMRTQTFETTRQTFSLSQQNQIYLSQPNFTSHTNTIEMQIHDSNDDSCACVQSSDHLHSHIQSFSQPTCMDNMFLNSQAVNTQTLSSQLSASQAVSPFIRLVKRMTRMFVHMNVDEAVDELKKLFHKYMYEFKIHTSTTHRQRQITVTTIDKRQMPLMFQINLIEMNTLQNDVLVDFRLSKGDGLEFKKIFLKFKASLANNVCKKYVFMNPSQYAASQCCGH